jgi:inward rectifier potassium channel
MSSLRDRLNQPSRVHITVGDFQGIKIGARRFDLHDTYYLVLTIPWSAFFAVAVSFYLLVNLGFATLYYLVPGCVNNVRPDVFLDYYFFSIETLATVGYGVMSPATPYGHIVASSEIIFGMMSMAVITGLVFVRFSRPRAKLLFSEVCVVAPTDGKQMLMLRIASERHQGLADATARLVMVRRTPTPEGRVLRRFIDLKLERETTPILAFSWTLMHAIDETSPLHGLSAEQLRAESSFLLVSITGYDESISATVTARHNYQADAILFGRDFVDIVDQLPGGELVLDLTHFHDTVPAVTTGS